MQEAALKAREQWCKIKLNIFLNTSVFSNLALIVLYIM